MAEETKQKEQEKYINLEKNWKKNWKKQIKQKKGKYKRRKLQKIGKQTLFWR